MGKKKSVKEKEQHLEEEQVAADNVEANDTVAEEQVERTLEEEIEFLKEQVEALKVQVKEKEDRYFRLQADLDNYRRRVKLDRAASIKYRAQELVTELLPIIDNFERALQVKTENEEVKSVLSGMEMVYKSLLTALESEGTVQIEAVGKEFDPHVHQAVLQVQEEGVASNTVVEELQKGYLLKDRVIRPSMVKVNK